MKPLDTAYSHFEIKPNMGRLNYIKCSVPSVKGDIELEIHKTDGKTTMSVTVPENTTAEVYLPLKEGYERFVIAGGKYSL